MRILINRPAVALVTFSALGLAACGADDSSSSRPTVTIPNPVAPSTPPAPAPLPPPAPFQPAPVNPNVPVPTPTTPVPTAEVPGVPPAGSTTTPPAVPPVVTPPPVTPTPETPPATTPTEPKPACAGTGEPVIPQTATGWFPANSNQSCFQGSWYCFADGVHETTCVENEPPWDATKMAMCITGETVEREEPDDYTAWGAGIGASLNDQDGDKEPFDADEAGITGFKFTVSGDLDGATLLFLIPTKTTSEDGPPEYTAKVGVNTVSFDDVVQPEWAGTKGPNTEKLYELKWQIKGGDTTSSYSFCISDLEPIYD